MKKQLNGFLFLFVLVATVSMACQTLTSGSDEPPLTESSGSPTEETFATTGQGCEVFNDIPAAAQYSSAPEMRITPAGQYTATMRLAKGGDIVIQLYAAEAPITVNSFVFLACKGFYDGTTFHRVLPDFMAQGGDPTGSGAGGPGYEFVNEYSDLTFSQPGVVAMANAGPDTNGSQFFITFGPQEYLNGGYTIFGQVTQGMDAVMSITLRDPETNPNFEGDVIESVAIREE